MENAWFDKTALIMCSESEAWSIGFIRPTGNSFYNQEPHDKILFIEETYLGCRHLGAVSTTPEVPLWMYWKEITSARLESLVFQKKGHFYFLPFGEQVESNMLHP